MPPTRGWEGVPRPGLYTGGSCPRLERTHGPKDESVLQWPVVPAQAPGHQHPDSSLEQAVPSPLTHARRVLLTSRARGTATLLQTAHQGARGALRGPDRPGQQPLFSTHSGQLAAPSPYPFCKYVKRNQCKRRSRGGSSGCDSTV